MVNAYVFDIGSICIRVKGILRKIYAPSKNTGISRWNACLTYLKSVIVGQSDEIYEVNTINCDDSSLKHLSLIGDEEVISLSHAKVHVFFQILCYAFGKMNRENPESNSAWEEQLSWFKEFTTIQSFRHNWRRTEGIRVEYFPRIHHIAACPWSPRVSCQKMSKQPEEFTGRIIFMSMFNDISWWSKDNEQEWELSANLVSRLDARGFSPGRWSFLGPGSEKKLPQVHCPRGTLKSKGGGKLSIHFCADEGTETVFRTNISVNQLSIYGADSDLCEEDTNLGIIEQGEMFWQDNLTHCLCQVWWRHLHLRPMILRKKFYCKDTKNKWKGSHNKIVW